MKLTIDKKVSLFISIMIVVFGALIGIYIIRDESEHMRQVLDERMSVLLGNLAINLEYPVMIRDTEAISRLVKGVMAQKDIAYCRVERDDGALLYQEDRRGEGQFREFAVPVVAKKGGEAEALIVAVPMEVSEQVGKVTLSVSLAELDNKITGMRITITTVVIVVISMVSLGTYFLLRRLVGRPVGRLVEATRRIAAGDLAHKVSLTTKDEFELLGDAFDRMSGSLLEAQQELVRREKMTVLGRLAEGVGNELRNPLGVMRNSVFFLKDVLPDANERVMEYLEIISSEIDNSHRIISDFIDFFRTRKPNFNVVPIREFVTQGIESCEITSNIELRVDLPDTLPLVHVDPSQMRQVFQNLITNAVQAMGNGGSLRVSARKARGARSEERAKEKILEPRTSNLEPAADFVEISVADTGPGISQENMEKLFQPLFTTKSRGIGLGLAICKSFVELNGGSISVESEPGRGTTFRVVLPVEGGEG